MGKLNTVVEALSGIAINWIGRVLVVLFQRLSNSSAKSGELVLGLC